MPNPNHCIECDKPAVIIEDSVYYCSSCALEEIDACPMEGFKPEEYDKILGLDKQNLKSVLVMPIGYRAKDDMFASFKKVRRPMEETIIEIKK